MRWAWVVLALAAPAVPAAPSVSRAGEIDAEVSLDYFRSSSISLEETLAANEIGMRLRFDLIELGDRLEIHADYHGRETLPSQVEDSVKRLLYRAEVRYNFVPRVFAAGLGRFTASSAVWLPVDGARLSLSPFEELEIEPWFGRRAITTSRQNVAFDRWYPAGGAALRVRLPRFLAEAAGALARDEIVLSQGESPARREYDAVNAFVRASARPVDVLTLGGEASFVQQATYLLGPTWSSAELEVQAVDVFNAAAYASWRVLPALSLDYDFHFQQAAVAAESVDTNFLDNQLGVSWRVFDIGWVRPRARFRVRPERNELRAGGSIDLDRLWPDGLYVRAFAAYEEAAELDRLLWSAALGWKGDFLEVEAGASFIERRAAPISSRDPVSGNEPADLAPFVLEAQRIVFGRAFFNWDVWFAGVDFEQSLEDSEIRLLAQAGTIWGSSW